MPQAVLEKKVVEVVVDSEITPEQVTELIFQVGRLGLNGYDCRLCGLLGIDVRLSGQDPETSLPPGTRSMVIS